MRKLIFKPTFLKGLLQNIISVIILILNKFLLVSIFLKELPTDTYGYWLYVVSFSSLWNMANIGWNKSVINHQILKYKNYEDSLLFFKSNIFFITIYSLLLFVIVSTISWFLNSDFSILLLTMLFYVFMNIPAKVIINQYIVKNKFYKSRLFLNIEEVFRVLLLISFLKLGFNIQYFGLCFLLPTLIIVIYIWFDNIAKSKVNLTIKTKFEYFKKSLNVTLNFFLQNISEVLYNESPILMIKENFILAKLPLYTTHKAIGNTLRSLFFMLNSVVAPEISHSAESKQNPLNITFFFNLVCSSLIFVFIFFLVKYGDIIFDFWLGNTIVFDQKLFLLFLAVTVTGIYRSTNKMLLNATNTNKIYSRLEFLFIIILVILIFFYNFDVLYTIVEFIFYFEILVYFSGLYAIFCIYKYQSLKFIISSLILISASLYEIKFLST